MTLLIRVSYRIGGDARNITQGLERINKMETAIEAIPIMKKDIDTLKEYYQRNRSDIKDLMRSKRGSRPDIEDGQ